MSFFYSPNFFKEDYSACISGESERIFRMKITELNQKYSAQIFNNFDNPENIKKIKRNRRQALIRLLDKIAECTVIGHFGEVIKNHEYGWNWRFYNDVESMIEQ